MKKRNPTRKDVDIRVRVIKFTRNELDMINSMCAIASASAWGEGDYQEFDKPPYTRANFNNLRAKVWELLKRTEYQTPSRKTQNQEPR